MLVYEIDVPQEFITIRGDMSSSVSEEAGELDADERSLADRIVSAVRRKHRGTEVNYAFVGFEGEPDRSDESTHGLSRPLELEDSPAAAQRIGSLIRAARREQGLTQKQLAARAGITQTVMSRTESGAGNPTLSLLEEIAAALDMQLDISLVGLER